MSSSNGDRADAFGRFFLPGPTEVRPQVLAAQTRPMIGHRGSAIQEIIGRLQEGLKPLFGTQRPVFISTSSASGLMEAAVRNGARSRVLCLVNGAFSERFANIARSCGMAVDTMAVPWGDVHDPQAVAERLDEGAYDSVTAVHSETSTGALNPLDASDGITEGTGTPARPFVRRGLRTDDAAFSGPARQGAVFRLVGVSEAVG
jgi:aspartate aminotransferase-like enzyme